MIERELAAKRITELEAKLAEAKSTAGHWMAKAIDLAEHGDALREKITELEAKLAEAEVNIKRLLETIDLIESDRFGYMRRADFAAQVLSGEFDPPTIAEIRKARGLEPL